MVKNAMALVLLLPLAACCGLVVDGVTAGSEEVDPVATALLEVMRTNTVERAGTNGWTVSAHQAWLTNETDTAALAALNGYKPTFCYDAADSNIFWAVVGGTNLVVWQVCSSNATAWRVASSSNGGQYVPGLELYLSGSGIDEMNNNRPWVTFTGANGAWIAFNPVIAGWLEGWWVMDVSTCPFSTLNGNSSDIDAASLSCSWWSDESSGEINLVRFSYPVVVTNEIRRVNLVD